MTAKTSKMQLRGMMLPRPLQLSRNQRFPLCLSPYAPPNSSPNASAKPHVPVASRSNKSALTTQVEYLHMFSVNITLHCKCAAIARRVDRVKFPSTNVYLPIEYNYMYRFG